MRKIQRHRDRAVALSLDAARIWRLALALKFGLRNHYRTPKKFQCGDEGMVLAERLYPEFGRMEVTREGSEPDSVAWVT